jgi:hypothetical protein
MKKRSKYSKPKHVAPRVSPHICPSGATSSHRSPAFASIPGCFLTRVARRFQLGDET